MQNICSVLWEVFLSELDQYSESCSAFLWDDERYGVIYGIVLLLYDGVDSFQYFIFLQTGRNRSGAESSDGVSVSCSSG